MIKTRMRRKAATVFASLFFLFPGAFAASGDAIGTVRQVRELSPDQAKLGAPVRVRGHVLVLSGWKNSFFFSDGSTGISINRLDTAPELHSGDLVEIEGKTAAGSFAPVISASRVHILGKAPLPPAPLRSYLDLAGGAEDSQWIQVKGIVHAAWIAPSWGHDVLFLNIDLGGGNIVARINNFLISDPSYLVDAEVRVNGVCGTNFNERRQLVGLRLFAADMRAISVEEPAPSDPFQLPLQTIDSIQQFRPGRKLGHRVRITGVVTYQDPGNSLYVQNGGQGLYIATSQSTPVPVGTMIEAVGFSMAGAYSPQLQTAIFRVIGHGNLPPPISLRSNEMIRPNADGFLTSPYDALVVRVRGKLWERISRPTQELLAVRDGDQLFRAFLPNAAGADVLPDLKTGSVVELTGVASIQSDENREPRSFELRLRSTDDVAVIKAPPWWNLRHSLFALGLLTLAAFAGLIGVTLLRREVRRQAERARQSEEKFRLLVAGVKDYAIFILTPDGYIATWNEGAERIKGYHAEEIIGLHFSKFYTPEDVARKHPAAELKIATETGRYEEEGWRIRKDGSRFWANVIITALRNQDGKLWGFGKVTRDITERMRADEALKESLETSARALKELADQKFALDQHSIVAVTDVQGTITYVNDKFCQISQYSRDELLGQNHRILNSGHHPLEFFQEMYRTIAHGQVWTGEIQNRAKDGALYWVDTTIVPTLSEEGKPRQYVAIRTDITERKKAEAALEKTRSDQLRFKDEFLSHVSHELRTPLTAIKQFTNILLGGLSGELNPEQRQYQEIVLKNVLQLQSMIDDLLEVTRLETGKLNVQKDLVAVGDAVTDSINTLCISAGAKGVALSAEVLADLPPAHADQTRLRQTLIILLDNAIKFTPEGGVVKVSVRMLPGNRRFLLFEVADTGCGMSPEDTQRIFERLYQSSGPSNPSRKGLGLGLFICRQLVTLQGGEIWVESQLQLGSIFSFTLPVFSLGNLISPLLIEDQWPSQCVALVTVELRFLSASLSYDSRTTFIQEVRNSIERCLIPSLDVLLPKMSCGLEDDRFFVVVFAGEEGALALSKRIREQFERFPPSRGGSAVLSVSHKLFQVPQPPADAVAEQNISALVEFLEKEIESQIISEKSPL